MVRFEDIAAARERIGDSLSATPLIADHVLSEHLQRRVLLKTELLQPTGSFKPRGVLNWIRTASADELAAGLGAVSAGNHARALAWAAEDAGIPVTVVMPENASPAKVAATREHDADVILHGDINGAWKLMRRLVDERGLTLVHPYDDPRIIAGQGTIGLEILEQAPDTSTIICPIGGGGLLSGIALAARALRPDLCLIGVEPEGAASMRHAWNHGGPTRLLNVDTCAWSLGAAIVGEHTYRICRAFVDNLMTVSEEGIRSALRHLLADCKLFAEPGAATAMAALREEALPKLPHAGDIVVVITGGNMGWDELQRMIRPHALHQDTR